MKPYYSEDGVTIYWGDCREVLSEVSPCADVLLTDPPYNVGKSYGAHDDNMERTEYIDWCRSWFTVVRSLCQRLVVFPGHGNLPVWWEVSKPSAIGCWHKPGNAGSSIIGWEEWEPWLYWTGDKGLLGGSSVITCPTGKQFDTGNHPCPKPVNLMSKLIKKTRATSVLDPFLGTGTTAIAARRMGIAATGIEIEERYCEIAAKRLSQRVLPLEYTA